MSCIFVGICSIGVAARSTWTGPPSILAELSEPDDDESEKLDSCVTGFLRDRLGHFPTMAKIMRRMN